MRHLFNWPEWEGEDLTEIKELEAEVHYYQSRKKLFLFNPAHLNAINGIIKTILNLRNRLIDDYQSNYSKTYI